MPSALASRHYGQGDAGETVLLLHGLFGSAAHWHHMAVPLSARHRVLAVDLRNHGASPHTESMDYPGMAEDVCALLDAQGLGRVHVVGHSMGGKVAMALALCQPQRLHSLVVLDMLPVPYPDRFGALVEALRAIDLAPVRTRADADRQLAPRVSEPRLRAMLLQNLVARGEGRWAWRIDWSVLAQALPVLMGFPPGLTERPARLPALFVRGALSDWHCAQGQAMARALFPLARFTELAGAGHWVHADQPGALLALLQAWLAEGFRSPEPARPAGHGAPHAPTWGRS